MGFNIRIKERNDCCVRAHRVVDQMGHEIDIFIVHPSQSLALECEITNSSNTHDLVSHHGVESELGTLDLPPNLSVAPGSTLRIDFELTAPNAPGQYMRRASWSAWSTDGLIYSQQIDYRIDVREFRISVTGPVFINADPGQEITLQASVSIDDLSARIFRWDLFDEFEGLIGSAQGSPLSQPVTRQILFTTHAPPVAGRFTWRLMLVASDNVGNTVERETEYTIEVPGSDFDPDRDGIPNDYEVRNG